MSAIRPSPALLSHVVTVLMLSVALLPALGAGCEKSESKSPVSYRSEGIDGSNGFESHETFRTSTKAATGYDAYFTWDSAAVYLAYTGQDLGEPACAPDEVADGEPCPRYEQGEASSKRLVYYFDTDPGGTNGTTEGTVVSRPRWRLPFRADYALSIRTAAADSGHASLYAYRAGSWKRQDVAVDVADNNGSKYLEVVLSRAVLGAPCRLQVVGGMVDRADGGASYAFWPGNAAPDADTAGVVVGGHVELSHAYGFLLIDGQTPNASDGQANLDRPFFAGADCASVNGDTAEGTSKGSARPFHTIVFTTSNDFSGYEVFRTSTAAATGYDAYATWDATNLYFGTTGSDIGPGDCEDTDATTCDAFETGQSPTKWLVYYLDTDPSGTAGSIDAIPFGAQSWTLPFRADYAVLIRTDGVTDERGYTGVADVKRWAEGAWESLGPSALEVFDNSTSGFLKVAVARDALGSPSSVRVVNWFFDTEADTSYAYWPANASASGDSLSTGPDTLRHAYGFRLEHGQLPNASEGLANLDRPFFGPYDCASTVFGDGGGDFAGRGRPFHTVAINGSNSFNTQREAFPTSTTAATGYTAYATWDQTRLYLGMTGSNIGGGDCSDVEDKNCSPAETGQGTDRWLVYYLDTDPRSSRGTRDALRMPDTLGTDQSWRLPFLADVAVLIRTDGQTTPDGHTGVAEVRRWDGQRWKSRGPCALDVWDNNGSGYLEAALSLDAIGYPYHLKIVGWMFGPETAYAYWPADAAEDGRADGVRLQRWWGFNLRSGVFPNALGNKNRKFLFGPDDQIPFTTYTVNGSRDDGEYRPAESLGRESPGAAVGPNNPELFATWDDTHLYLGLLGDPLIAGRSDLWVAFDTDPATGADPRSGRGLATQPSSEATHATSATYPFAADRVFQFEGMPRDSSSTRPDSVVRRPAPGRLFIARDSTWVERAMPDSVRMIRPSSGAPTEIAIPWSAVGARQAADAARFHVVFYLIDAENGIDAQWPPENPNGSDVAFSVFRTYTPMPGVVPSADATRSLRTESGATLNDQVYANLYLVPESPQTVTLGAHTTVVGELLVGRRATLDVGANGKDPTGHNRLRIGQRLTVRGTFEPREGVVLTFDPAEGYPEAVEPGGGFGRLSRSTEIAGGTLHALTLHNRTKLVSLDGDSSSDSTRVLLRGPLTIAAGGRLHGRSRLVTQDAASMDSTRSASNDTARGTTGTATWTHRVARFLRGEDRSPGDSERETNASAPTPSRNGERLP